MVKIADEHTLPYRCVSYLMIEKNYNWLPETIFYFIEDKGGNPQAIAGWNKETGSLIEPFFFENKFSAYRLWSLMKKTLKAKGFNTLSIITDHPLIKSFLKTEGFILFNKGNEHYIKLNTDYVLK